ncbi:MAG: 3-isopropylmalate dehydrogenase [Phaeodactylibacter sp.]|nr:3-isopropylmalate dehydrogenase [Phaeodactylibacter sp.]MCB9049879.1 3-isopropylmalate dehydrogenase [Lewinellaceae bacterium]
MTSIKKTKIAVLAGDGIGPEVTNQAIKVMDAIAERFGGYFEYCFADVGAVAIDRTGNPLPDITLEACLNADAILFGAIGDPKYDNDPKAKVRPEQGLLRLRKELGLYANIRPVTTYERLLHLSPLREDRVKGVDLVIYRELTGGIYFGEKGTSADGKQAFDTCTYHVEEIQRIAKLAFEQALLRRGKVTLVDKANVMETSRLWRQTVKEMAKDYPGVELDYMFVDNAAMQLIQNPRQFDVMLTSNMFGDILSDEASVLAGSMGLLPSASIGVHTSLFEPIHGSYPQAAGQDIANPMAAILSAAMLVESLGLTDAAKAIRLAIQHILEKGIGTPELQPSVAYGCSQIGDLVAHLVTDPNEQILVREDKLQQKVSTII